MNHILYLHLFAKVKSASVLSTSAYCGNNPPVLVRLVIKGGGGGGQVFTVLPHVQKPNSPGVNAGMRQSPQSPHTADVLWHHVAVLAALERFGKFREILE